MSAHDEAARKARAERLRKKINALVSGHSASEEPAEEKPTTSTESPRAFVERRMRELANKKKKKKARRR